MVPGGGVFGMHLNQEGGALVNETSALTEAGPERPPGPAATGGHNEKARAVSQAGRGPRLHLAGTRPAHFQPPEKSVPIVYSYSVHILLQQPKQTKAHQSHTHRGSGR